MTNDKWAHVIVDTATGAVKPHRLDEHLNEVAKLASQFANDFAPDWAHLAGLWHDLGKYRPGFQGYIRRANALDAHIEGRIQDRDKTHSAAGALWAERILTQRFGPPGQLMSRVLQYVIAGHHAGLDNWDSGLAARLASEDAKKEFEDSLAQCPPDSVLTPPTIALLLKSAPIGDERSTTPGRFALWVRMLFSALIDADFLDTEMFMNAQQGASRQSELSIPQLKVALDSHLASLAESADQTAVNQLRGAVLAQCQNKAVAKPGVFTLTVPTGGGKTLSSLAFALDHAALHGKRRVIYAIPYTSIIEQTAETFRSVFAALGEDAVVEHHSNAEADPKQETARSRLACENWDSPLVVTTNVQLFESLFARRTSRCRKLHNLVGSVIVLDEAQLLPVEFLQPIVDVLQLLVADFGVTLLLCTATQPVLSASASADPKRGLRRGFDPKKVVEIIDDVPALYGALQRVKVHLPLSLDTPRLWPELASEIAAHECALSIVSRRADARELFTLVRERSGQVCWHLSGLMCAQHRSDVIAQIKSALAERRRALAQDEQAPRIQVVSTQLVEAGVDLDFPVVYRALAGLDSIAQAAGRCNREGKLNTLGHVHVFVPPTAAPPGLLRQARDTCKVLWQDRPADPFSHHLFHRYFQRLYHDAPSLDAEGICEALRLQASSADRSLAVRFRDASDNFRLIDDEDSATVLVRYRSPQAKDDINALIGTLERDGPSRWLMRKLQRFGVTVYRYQLDKLLKSGDVVALALCPGLYVQSVDWDGFYHPLWGANLDGAPGDPAYFVS